MKGGSVGEGAHAPGDSPVCEVSPSGGGGAAGSGWHLFWSPGISRPSSELARAPDGRGGAGFESQFPFDWVSGSSAGLLLSWSVIHGLFLGLLYLCGFCWAAHNSNVIL